MTPYYQDDWLTVMLGDCREVMATMEPESVHCVVTSPPYWGLRDYGTATWLGGDDACDHKHGGQVAQTKHPAASGTVATGLRPGTDNSRCGKCGAIREDSQLGLEPTPEAYVESMVAVFREVRRVLRSDGTVWLNLGDSYFGTGKGPTPPTGMHGANGTPYPVSGVYTHPNLKGKDLVGIPWRVAFALQQPYYTGAIKDERDRTWLAGLMDGEGTFTILSTTSPHGSSNSYPPIAQVRMTSQGVVQKAASLVGVASPAQYPPSNRGNRAIYQWRLSGRRAADVARELYPYLIEKRKQAMVVWNHQEVRDGYETKRGVRIPVDAVAKQQVCRDIIRRLNHGEDVDLPSWMVEPPSLLEPGWYLRSDVIWSKPNPMPESVTDRPTKSHEYLFLLTKSPRYYFDADAVREPQAEYGGPDGYASRIGRKRYHEDNSDPKGGGLRGEGGFQTTQLNPGGRNIRSVWTIATQPYPGAHFATFPQALVEPCIKAGTSERGVCAVESCEAPFVRVVTKGESDYERYGKHFGKEFGRPDSIPPESKAGGNTGNTRLPNGTTPSYRPRGVETTGWRPTCDHHWDGCERFGGDCTRPATVLDPFAGSGTTGLVAQRLSRRAVLIDLNGDYLQQVMDRNRDIPLGLGA